jgi:hypothetical protein
MGKAIVLNGFLYNSMGQSSRKKLRCITMQLLLLMFTLVCKNSLLAQVGIGTNNPDTSTILDIRSSTKGVLIPRLTELQRSKITETADGLLVQDLLTGKTATNRNNYGQWGVIDPVINQNIKFTAFFTATAVHVLNYAPSGNSHQWTTFSISGPLLGVCSSDNLIVFVTQTHVNAIYENTNNVVQFRSQAITGGSIVDMGVTNDTFNGIAVLLKGNTVYRFDRGDETWSSGVLSSTPANMRVLQKDIIFTAGNTAFIARSGGIQSVSISGSKLGIYANAAAAIIHTTTNLYSFVPLDFGGGMDILTNTLTTGVTNVYDNGLEVKSRIVVQTTDKLWVLRHDSEFGGQWTSINIAGPVDKVVAADKF